MDSRVVDTLGTVDEGVTQLLLEVAREQLPQPTAGLRVQDGDTKIAPMKEHWLQTIVVRCPGCGHETEYREHHYSPKPSNTMLLVMDWCGFCPR